MHLQKKLLMTLNLCHFWWLNKDDLKEDFEMDELVSVMQEILAELREMNSKLDEIQGIGINNSLSDVCDKLDSLETTITMGDNY